MLVNLTQRNPQANHLCVDMMFLPEKTYKITVILQLGWRCMNRRGWKERPAAIQLIFSNRLFPPNPEWATAWSRKPSLSRGAAVPSHVEHRPAVPSILSIPMVTSAVCDAPSSNSERGSGTEFQGEEQRNTRAMMEANKIDDTAGQRMPCRKYIPTQFGIVFPTRSGRLSGLFARG